MEEFGEDVGASLPDVDSRAPLDVQNVRKAIEALCENQTEHDKVKAKFLKNRAALEAVFHKECNSLYDERLEIVNGANEVDREVGVPAFWLKAMQNNEVLAKEITETDQGPLKYLKDIKWCRLDTTTKGFKLEFYFRKNEYFSNDVLTITYRISETYHEDEPILENIIGTEIKWQEEKNVIHKRKHGSEKINDQDCKSFFTFFDPSLVPNKEPAAEVLQKKMCQHYYVGCTIRDKIIPHAVSWFTGEAARLVYYGGDSDGNDMGSAQDKGSQCESEDTDEDSGEDSDKDLEENYGLMKESLDNCLDELDCFGDSCTPLLKKQCQNWPLVLALDVALGKLKPEEIKRVDNLRKIQTEHDKAKAKFLKKRADLENGFHEECKSLYEKRSTIVNGANGEVGVSDFWLKAMQNNEVLAKEITEKDQGPLKYLKDIKWCRLDTTKGFQLEFYFRKNKYFCNDVLTKTYRMSGTYMSATYHTYHMDDDEPILEDDDEPILEEVEGTEIEWKYGEDSDALMTQKSFFDFFDSTQFPESDDDISDEEQDEVHKDEQLQIKIHQDYDVGCTIRDKIIPHAVWWFTGEAGQKSELPSGEGQEGI